MAQLPFTESHREQYAGDVTFVARYFPIPSHTNALNARIAAEAAARKGRFEEMYVKPLDTRTRWAEQPDSKADVFRRITSTIDATSCR